MKCAECGKEITNTGYWSTFNGKVREDYHPECKPIYFWTKKDQVPAEKQKYLEIKSGKDWQ